MNAIRGIMLCALLAGTAAAQSGPGAGTWEGEGCADVAKSATAGRCGLILTDDRLLRGLTGCRRMGRTLRKDNEVDAEHQRSLSFAARCPFDATHLRPPDRRLLRPGHAGLSEARVRQSGSVRKNSMTQIVATLPSVAPCT